MRLEFRHRDTVVRVDGEPLYREFFTQVAQLCGRSVVS